MRVAVLSPSYRIFKDWRSEVGRHGVHRIYRLEPAVLDRHTDRLRGWQPDRYTIVGRPSQYRVGLLAEADHLLRRIGVKYVHIDEIEKRRVFHVNERNAEAVLIDRTTALGNPFRLGRDGDRFEVLEKYQQWLRETPGMIELIRRRVPPGYPVECHCFPQPCHGDTLVRVAEGGQP